MKLMDDLIKQEGVYPQKFKKGQIFLRQGERVQCVYYMTKGTLYRTITTDRGDEIFYGSKTVTPDAPLSTRLVGVLAMYSEDGISRTAFIAMTDCEGYMIPRDVFLRYAEQDAALLTSLLRMAMADYCNLMTSYQARQEKQIANQLCALLLQNMVQEQSGQCYVRNLSNLELASFLGIHQVTVSKILKQLKNLQVLQRVPRGWQILDLQQLQHFADGEKLEYH